MEPRRRALGGQAKGNVWAYTGSASSHGQLAPGSERSRQTASSTLAAHLHVNVDINSNNILWRKKSISASSNVSTAPLHKRSLQHVCSRASLNPPAAISNLFLTLPRIKLSLKLTLAILVGEAHPPDSQPFCDSCVFMCE